MCFEKPKVFYDNLKLKKFKTSKFFFFLSTLNQAITKPTASS